MKAGLITLLLLIIFTAVVEAAITTPPPVSARCRIVCVVTEKAEWKTDEQPAKNLLSQEPQTQTDSNPVLIINSGNESTLEIDDMGQFHSSNLPIEIITATQIAERQKPAIKTLTACWKI